MGKQPAPLEASAFNAFVGTVRRIAVGNRAQLVAMNRAIAHHKLRPVIDRVFGFREAADAFRYYEAGNTFGKVVILGAAERLAELQEEILWICEAAHLPVTWATQVLEHLAKDGRPSRAEITDAAMSARAECVMLNKGPHIVDAVCVLDDILRRMAHHQAKKRSMLRQLALATHFDKMHSRARPHLHADFAANLRGAARIANEWVPCLELLELGEH
jgi:hypothetical protein